MNVSQFDGAAAFSGGGFMPSQTTQTTDSAPAAFSKKTDTHTLIPLTVKQINNALLSNDDKVNFLIDGVDVNNVKLIGTITNKAERVTDVSFAIDDGTGRIDCNRWMNEPIDTKEMDALAEGTYVRVHGQLKGFQGKKQLVVFGIKPVVDFDEITHHFVECIYVHSYNTKLLKQQASTSNGNQYQVPPSSINAQAYQTAPPNQFAGQYVADGLTGVDKLVLNYLQQPASLAREGGIHQDELAQQLKIPKETIMMAIEGLVQEGLLYSSIDDFHFKSTGNA
ncbi:hypothetical protein LXL04_006568 [Taraxacum kok-saghyz]